MTKVKAQKNCKREEIGISLARQGVVGDENYSVCSLRRVTVPSAKVWADDLGFIICLK